MTTTESSARAASHTPIRVVSWSTKDGRIISAVRAPLSSSDPTPWAVYEGDNFVERVASSRIPPSATTMFSGVGETATIEDGRFYEVIVDRAQGFGVRNSPLTLQTPDRPWAVSLYSSARDTIALDALPDGSVAIIRPCSDES